MEIIQIVGLGLVAALLAIVLKEQKPVFAFLITVFAGVLIIFFLVGKIVDVIRVLERLAVEGGINLIYLKTILQIIGIAYIAEFAAQVTRDAGQGAIASKIELAGKVLIMAMAIPIITVIIETVIGIIPS